MSQNVLLRSLRYPMLTARAIVPDDVIRMNVMIAMSSSGTG